MSRLAYTSYLRILAFLQLVCGCWLYPTVQPACDPSHVLTTCSELGIQAKNTSYTTSIVYVYGNALTRRTCRSHYHKPYANNDFIYAEFFKSSKSLIFSNMISNETPHVSISVQVPNIQVASLTSIFHLKAQQ